MRHEQWKQATMIAPAPGFTGRVMARIAERERAAARRRALIGAAVLVLAALGMLALLATVALALVTSGWDLSEMVWSAISGLSSFLDLTGTVAETLWSAGNTLADTVGIVPVLVYAVVVCALTVLWARIVSGSTQLASQTMTMGEQL